MPAYVCLSGIAVGDDTAIEMPWGRMTAARPHQRLRSIEAPEPAAVVVKTTFPVKAYAMSVSDPPPPEVGAGYEFGRRLTSETAIAALLASDLPWFVNVRQAGLVICDPLGFPGNWAVSVSPEAMPPAPISDAMSKSLGTWAARYSAAHHKTLDVAVGRAVSAAARKDPSDGFIDAVVGWENLFGSGDGEVTLRLAASFARLLGTDADHRRAIAAEVRTEYHERSRLIHGATDLSFEQAGELRDRALGRLLAALRQLYAARPDLVKMNSGERSASLLLW